MTELGCSYFVLDLLKSEMMYYILNSFRMDLRSCLGSKMCLVAVVRVAAGLSGEGLHRQPPRLPWQPPEQPA